MSLKFFLNLLIFGNAGSLLLHGFFSGFSEQGLLSSCGAQASHCEDFFVAEHGL